MVCITKSKYSWHIFFLQLTPASCIHNVYKSDYPIIGIKWVNESFDRGSSYYKINVEVLKDKDYIKDVKNILLQAQDNYKIYKKISGNIFKCNYVVLV